MASMTQKTNPTAQIFDIQRFSVNDGPGIRTVIFFCGCPLSCPWCHNPEGMRVGARLLYNAERCISCGRCVATCKRGAHSITDDGNHRIDRASCVSCGACAEVCVEDALRIASREVTLDEAFDELMQDRLFYKNSGGGVTFSGGEPLIRPDFVIALAERLREVGVHVAVETSGYVDPSDFRRIADSIDLFLFDIKETDREAHARTVGVDSARILENLAYLSEISKPTVLRCPLIPGINDRPDHAAAIGGIAESHSGVERVEIMPYHSLGLSKYEQLGISAPYARRDELCRADAERFCDAVRLHTSKPVRIG